MEALQQEISSLQSFQSELQKDFDLVQLMLDDKEKDLEALTQELQDTKMQDTVVSYSAVCFVCLRKSFCSPTGCFLNLEGMIQWSDFYSFRYPDS